MNNQNCIEYPITIEYAEKWGIWEALRELRANAEDTKTSVIMTKIDNDLIIQDQGVGIQLPQLLLGVHESGDNTIGQFGEGLKIALLVLLRNGHATDIYTNNLHLQNSIGNMFGHDVLKITWEEIPAMTGTKIVIHNWESDDYFQDRFLFDPEDMRIITTNQYGSILDGDISLFSKGVYVNELTDYAFGYNSYSLTMNRDRAAVRESEIQDKVGEIWSKVTSTAAWSWFFNNSVNKSTLEKFIHLTAWYLDADVKEAINNGWIKSFGPNAVIKTDDEMEREAKHRGAKVIDPAGFGYQLTNCLQAIIKTDKQYVEEKGGLKPKPINKLTPEQRKNLNLSKKMVKKLECDMIVEVAELPSGALGICDYENNKIWLSINAMNDALTTGSVVIHELAHAIYYTNDMTEAHCEAMCKIGMRLYQ